MLSGFLNGHMAIPGAICLVVVLGTFSAPRAEQALDEVVVIGVTPSHGAALPEEKIPYNVQSATSEDIERSESLDLSDFLNRNLASVNLNEAQNNPLQPDLQYRGFAASPLLGLAQGLAVYQNGARINEPLGDTINWDLLPEEAIHSVELIGGANPVFGLNALGGALSVRMKDGFNSAGHSAELWGGSFDRRVVDAESGANNGTWGYYVGMNYFDEDGWRELSESDSLNVFGSFGWRGTRSALNLNAQYGSSELFGNGPLPVELMAIERDTVFTAPDITENDMVMVSLDGSHELTHEMTVSGTAYYRRNETDSFNGDGTELALCGLGGAQRLLDGLEDDDLEELGLEEDDVCGDQFADAGALEDFLNAAAGAADVFHVEDLTDEISGTGVLSDQAINNQSARVQKSRGVDLQLSLRRDVFGKGNQLVFGGAWYRGTTAFDAVVELARFDPATRSSLELGTGAFLDPAATNIHTATESWSLYFTDTLDVTDRFSVTISGRYNNTAVDLADQSGERPELNGEHDFDRFNPALGATFSFSENMNLYAGYSESSRAPTPIELSCNDRIFEIAVANAVAEGGDPDDVEFECRLPNAFLSDPPLDQVVAESWEAGVRGRVGDRIRYRAAFFHTVSNDDIIFQSTGRSTGLFANVDETRRMGFEGSLTGAVGNLEWYGAYSYIHATFQDNLAVLSPNHEFADEDGTIQVRPGDHIPGIPAHQFKLGADVRLAPTLGLGLDLLYNSRQVMRGDESNQLDRVDGYAVVNVRGSWTLTDQIELLARVTNLFNADYETFGLLGEDPSSVDLPEFQGFNDPRFLGPAAPRAGFVGIRVSL
ncbi:MAG: TonB-dependent receptor [Gammaproteobacteria bacterium]|nr:TonB-dependent receptor [Gammaproteobacteria bacterium]